MTVSRRKACFCVQDALYAIIVGGDEFCVVTDHSVTEPEGDQMSCRGRSRGSRESIFKSDNNLRKLLIYYCAIIYIMQNSHSSSFSAIHLLTNCIVVYAEHFVHPDLYHI